MISCHASPVALLRGKRNQVKVKAVPQQQGVPADDRHSWNIPEEEGQGLEEGLEVVVMIYCVALDQLDVSKHLRKQESRWLTSNRRIQSVYRQSTWLF